MSYYVAPIVAATGPAILRYKPHEEPSPEVPFELRQFYTQDIWAPRISTVTRKASRYYKNTLEWAWLVLTFVALIAAPVATYYIALHHIPEPTKDDRGHFRDGFDRYWKARLIGFAVFLLVMLLAFAPMSAWKRSGKKAVNRMFQEYEAQDRAARPGVPVPSLRMKMPGVISKHMKFVVTVPAGSGPSLYQPGANVPPYLANPPADSWQQPWQAQPPQSQWGVQPGQPPMYGGYNGNGNAPPMAYSEVNTKHENPFEDVKV